VSKKFVNLASHRLALKWSGRNAIAAYIKAPLRSVSQKLIPSDVAWQKLHEEKFIAHHRKDHVPRSSIAL
jgi:hypothetical protein